ncbi:serine-pyruvate aminotransferase [Xanthomonas oryzae pv. oryzae]|nr:serine-pyruvate aminotransferase [Xanthomonas oryzae pv. oryzae]
MALTAKGVIDTEEDFDEFYCHLVNYNLYIYSKFHIQTQSFRIGCIGAIEPKWILTMETAFRDFFENRKRRLTGAKFSNSAIAGGAV